MPIRASKFTLPWKSIMSNIRETDGLGNATVPPNYNTPDFELGTATTGGLNPDQTLLAATAAGTPNGIDPLNKGFQIGEDEEKDDMNEFEQAKADYSGNVIGGGKPTAPLNSPSHPAMASMTETEDNFMDERGNPFVETDDFIGEDVDTFSEVDALPEFDDDSVDPSIAALPVDANGIIEPIVVPDEVIVEPELGEIPDVALPLEEPIVELDSSDVDVQIPENVFENDGAPEPIKVESSFKLPENQRIIVMKGDQIFHIGKVCEEFTPKFAESVFSRALKSLTEGKPRQIAVSGNVKEKVALVGRSVLVEVCKDWRLPGTNVVFEAHDLLQIVSMKPISEATDTGDDDEKKESDPKKKKEDDAKSKEKAEEEKFKKEAIFAMRRWKEAEKKRKESDGKKDEDDDNDDDDDDNDTPEKKAKKERAKRESRMLEKQRTGGWL